MAHAEDIIRAVQAADHETLRKLLLEHPALARSRDEVGVSALMHAIYRRQTLAIDLLRQASPSLDIFEAAALGDMDSLAAIIARDPSLTGAYSPDGFTALHFSAFFSQPLAARFLLDHGANHALPAKNPTQVMPLHSAAAGDNIEAVRTLLAHGAPVDARQQHGWTALHSAAQNGNLEMVDLLLQHGADPAIQNDDGVTALELARKRAHADVVNRLARAQSAPT